jgi:glycosyltransferase involved in cell wall biosynthesis
VGLSIDVLLPYWGDVGYFKQAVGSVLAQEDPDWRLVVVDDGFPSDEPGAWTSALDDPRVEYHRNDVNLGANANYVKALGLATADLVVVMGADDVMLPNYLACIRDGFGRHPAVDVVQPGVEVIDGAGRVTVPLADRVKAWYAPRLRAGEQGTPERVLSGAAMATSLVRADWAYFPSLAWRRTTIAGLAFRPGLHVVQDLALLLDIAAGGGSLLVVGEKAFQYRRHSGSDSSVKAVNGVRFDEERAFFAGEAARFTQLGWSAAAREARWHLSSRMHAATLLPVALRLRDSHALRGLWHHVVG